VDSFESFDGVEIAFTTCGPLGGTRPPVVLHHGFTADGNSNWVLTGVVDALREAGRRVVVPDARGHGRSGKPHEPSCYGESRMARDLACLTERLGFEQIDLAGYSMGAVVALLYASRHGGVRRLVVGGVGAGVIECGGVDRRGVSNESILAALSAEDEEDLAAVPEAARAFRRLADALGADRLALLAQAASIHRAGVEPERITAPTLVLAGSEDPMAIRPEVLAEALPDGSLRMLDGNHVDALADPRFAASIVEFLGPDES
jgi:pimeloyl-ACP methyl ester carboxylesterase